MKLYNIVIAVFFATVIVEANCGLVDEVYGKLKNTTKVIKDDVKSWWYYGKNLVIGNSNSNQENIHIEEKKNETDNYLEKDGSIIEETFIRIKSRVYAIRRKIHDVVLGGDQPNKGFVKSMYQKVKLRVSRVKVFILGENEIKTNETANEQEKTPSDYIDQTKVIRDKLHKFLFPNDSKLSKEENSLTNITSDLEQNVMQYQRNLVNKEKDFIDNGSKYINKLNSGLRTAEETFVNNIRGVYVKEESLEKNTEKNTDGKHLKDNIM